MKRLKRRTAASRDDATAHLLRSPANAKRLLAAIASLEKGTGKARKIDLAS